MEIEMLDNSMITSFITLFAMATALIIVMLIVKKLILKNRNISNNLELKILSKLPLRQKTSLYVVKVGTKTLLIGASDQNIRAIADVSTEYNKHQTADEIIKRPESSAIEQAQNNNEEVDLSFANFIKSAFRRQRN